MSIKRRAWALVAAALLALGLVACGGEPVPEEVAVYTVEIQQPFTGREPRDPAELGSIVDEALKLVDQRRGKMKDDSEETKLAKKVDKKFNKANEAYREGDYAAAQEGYEGVLSTYPLHFGANVNLTLALLQQEKNEEALAQALSCMDISPEEGVLLNVQAAGVACGFSADDLEPAMDQMLESIGRDTYGDKDGYVDNFGSQYLYNKVWDNIETLLRVEDAPAEEESGDAEEADGTEEAKEKTAEEAEVEAAKEAEAAEEAVEEEDTDKRTWYQKYDAISTDMKVLESDLPDDTDVQALSAYLYVVGLQLGYEADPKLIEPVHSMPYIAVDNDLCTIRVVELTGKKGEERLLNFEVTNKTEDTTFAIGKGTKWWFNEHDPLTHMAPTKIAPGEVGDVILETGYSGDEDITSIMGTIVVSSVEQNSVLARYPIYWEAAEQEE